MLQFFLMLYLHLRVDGDGNAARCLTLSFETQHAQHHLEPHAAYISLPPLSTPSPLALPHPIPVGITQHPVAITSM